MPDIKLRSVTESDLPILFEFQMEPEGNAMAAFPARGKDEFLAHWRKIFDDKSCIALAVIVEERVAGNIGSWTQGDKRLVGYWLGKQFWGKGIATEALSQFVGQCTQRPLYGYVASHNIGSIRVLQKCGFVQIADEGDECLYALTNASVP